MMDMEYNRTSPFISNCLHYSSEFHPYVGEFAYIWPNGEYSLVSAELELRSAWRSTFAIFVISSPEAPDEIPDMASTYGNRTCGQGKSF